ncbi:MAG: hypothetical protein ACK4YP_13530 [Myxococcota bacterium]
MLLLLLAACGSDECLVESSEVADDALLGDLAYTAGDVVSAATGTFEVTVESLEHGWVGAAFTVARGEGDATFHDATLRQRLDFDDVWIFSQEMDLEIGSFCFDEVEVPVHGTLVAADLEVDLAFTGTATPPELLVASAALGEVWLLAQLPVDTPGLPAPPEGATEAFLQATLQGGELVSLRLSWSIAVDGGGTGAEEVLRFPLSPSTR